jgi:hypothetical protein
VHDDQSIELLVETSRGTFIRRIAPASLLHGTDDRGREAERATRDAAARAGMPDFVFRPGRVRRGHGSREIGDAVLLSGERALVIQVKARTVWSGNLDRERRWLDREIADATRQSTGTLRSMLAVESVRLRNERDREVDVDVAEHRWAHVVILDHRGLDDYVPSGEAITLLRRDWEFLFEQLGSTYAVVEYVHRVSSEGSVGLGLEPVRYYQLAQADEDAKPTPLDRRLAEILQVETSSVPLLPRQPVGTGPDRAAILFRWILEDVSATRHPSERERLAILTAIDAIPVSQRAALGRGLLEMLDKVDGEDPPVYWARNLFHTHRPYVILAVASRMQKGDDIAFQNFVAWRHQEHRELLPERGHELTTGVLLTPRKDGHRPWDTTAVVVSGDFDFTPESRAMLRDHWGPLGTRGELADRGWTTSG